MNINFGDLSFSNNRKITTDIVFSRNQFLFDNDAGVSFAGSSNFCGSVQLPGGITNIDYIFANVPYADISCIYPMPNTITSCTGKLWGIFYNANNFSPKNLHILYENKFNIPNAVTNFAYSGFLVGSSSNEYRQYQTGFAYNPNNSISEKLLSEFLQKWNIPDRTTNLSHYFYRYNFWIKINYSDPYYNIYSNLILNIPTNVTDCSHMLDHMNISVASTTITPFIKLPDSLINGSHMFQGFGSRSNYQVPLGDLYSSMSFARIGSYAEPPGTFYRNLYFNNLKDGSNMFQVHALSMGKATKWRDASMYEGIEDWDPYISDIYLPNDIENIDYMFDPYYFDVYPRSAGDFVDKNLYGKFKVHVPSRFVASNGRVPTWGIPNYCIDPY